jgi:FAD/FMN-containing dehydrogenase
MFAMEGYVEEVRAALTARWPAHRCWVFGHLGDGNLHLVIRAGAPDAAMRSEVERRVYGPLERIGGSISAEHGVGLEKKPYLGISRSAEEIELMRTIKRSLDPRNILNPGKIF